MGRRKEGEVLMPLAMAVIVMVTSLSGSSIQHKLMALHPTWVKMEKTMPEEAKTRLNNLCQAILSVTPLNEKALSEAHLKQRLHESFPNGIPRISENAAMFFLTYSLYDGLTKAWGETSKSSPISPALINPQPEPPKVKEQAEETSTQVIPGSEKMLNPQPEPPAFIKSRILQNLELIAGKFHEKIKRK